MSILNTDYTNFEIRYGDLADTIRVYVRVESDPRDSYAESGYSADAMCKIEEAIKAMPKPKLSGRDIHKIIKSVLGVNMNVRYIKADYPKGYQLCQFFTIKDPSQHPDTYDEDRMSIPIPGTPYYLRRIHISTRLYAEAQQEGFVY